MVGTTTGEAVRNLNLVSVTVLTIISSHLREADALEFMEKHDLTKLGRESR